MRNFISTDSRIRLLLWSAFVLKDFFEYPLALSVVDIDYVGREVAAARGQMEPRCPFKARRTENPDEANGYDFHFVHNYLSPDKVELYVPVKNLRLLRYKLREYKREMLGSNVTEFSDILLKQLSIQHLLTPLDKELGSMNMPYRYIFIYGSIIAAALMLFDHSSLDPRPDVSSNTQRAHHFYIPRVLVIAYCVGPTTGVARMEDHDREHDAALFLSWAFVMGITEFVLRYCNQMTEKEASSTITAEKPMFERRLHFLRLLVGGLFTLFTYALLAIVVIAKSDGLSFAYKFMLLTDTLAGMFRAAYVVSRVITVAATGPEVEGRQTSSHKAVVNLAEDYFEAIFYAIALAYGLFMRRRLMALLLVSHIRFLIQRVARPPPHPSCHAENAGQHYLL